ncbi:MAG: YbhN family protein [Halobacteriales archaeon]
MGRDNGATALYDQFADRRTLLKIVLGFVVAGLLVFVLGVAVGLEDVRLAFRRADLRWLAVACASTLVGLAAWSKAWQVVLAVVDIEVPFRRLVVTYLSATFANYITPFGQAGGEPFIAFVLSQDTGASYEDSLASVVIADLLNLLPFFNFAAIGLAVLLVRVRLPDVIRPLAFGLAGVAVAIPAIAYVGWNHRGGVEYWVLRLLRPLVGRTKRFSIEGIRDRIDRFYASVELIADEPRRLAYALVFSYAGWLFFALPLYVAGVTLGLQIEPLLVLFVVPASTVAGLVPTPGGLGGVEAALVVLLVALAPLGPGQAFAVATVYRVASYWFALVVGAAATVYVIARA